MKSIAETFEVAVQMIGCDAELVTGKLERRKSSNRNQMNNPFQLLNPLSSFTKSSPESFKNAG